MAFDLFPYIDMSFRKARKVCRVDNNKKWIPAAKEFLACEAEAQHQFLRKWFRKIPPREMVERWASVIGAKLHPSNLMWQHENCENYIDAVERCSRWFETKHRQGTRRCRGIVKEGVEEEIVSHGSGIVTDRLLEHLKRLKVPSRLRGMQNWKTMNDICQEASVQVGSGSTETEAINAELTHLLFAHPVTLVSKAWWLVCVQCAFLRVVYRRSHTGILPNFVRGDHALSAKIMSMVRLLLEMQSPQATEIREMEEKWNMDL